MAFLNKVLVFTLYGTKTYYPEKFYYKAQENVLYWPRMASLWITSEASDLKDAMNAQYLYESLSDRFARTIVVFPMNYESSTVKFDQKWMGDNSKLMRRNKVFSIKKGGSSSS